MLTEYSFHCWMGPIVCSSAANHRSQRGSVACCCALFSVGSSVPISNSTPHHLDPSVIASEMPGSVAQEFHFFDPAGAV